MNIFHDPVFQSYALAVAAIVLTLYGLAFRTVATRASRKVEVNAEDIGTRGATLAPVEHPDVLRVKRAHLNLLENALPFFAIGLLYTMTDPNLTLARILFGGFVAVRVAHAFFYLGAKQPWRTLSFATGALVNIVMVVQVGRAVFAAW